MTVRLRLSIQKESKENNSCVLDTRIHISLFNFENIKHTVTN
jgi:hypothetical protein